MPDKIRPALALLVLFASGLFVYLWLGLYAAFGFTLGLTTFWLVIGISSAYWIGLDEHTELLVQELMRRIREDRTAQG